MYVGEGFQRPLEVEVTDPRVGPVEGTDEGQTAGDNSRSLPGEHAVEGEAPSEGRVDSQGDLGGAPLGGLGEHQTSWPRGSLRTSKDGQALAAYWLWPETLVSPYFAMAALVRAIIVAFWAAVRVSFGVFASFASPPT